MATVNSVVASSMGLILAPPPPLGFALVNANIHAISFVCAQSQTSMVLFAKQVVVSQAQALIA